MTQNTKQATSLLALSRTDKEMVTRRDLPSIHPSMLVVEKGFNVRNVGLTEEEYWELPNVVALVEGLAEAYTRGEPVQPIMVKFDPVTQKALIRDGHHRYRGLMLAIERGADIRKIMVIETKGDEANDLVLMLNSSNSQKLSPVSRAEIYHRFQAYGYTVEEIAQKVNMSVPHVYQVLNVYDLPIEVKKRIQLGLTTVEKALAEKRGKSTGVKAFKPPRKAVNQVLELVGKATIQGDTVSLEIPLELYNQLVDQSKEAETNEDQLDMLQSPEAEADSSQNLSS